MKILIDTNIVLDVALERQPYLSLSDQVLVLVEQSRLEGYISASTFTDLYYIIRKERRRDWTLDFLIQLLTFCNIATVDQGVIVSALGANFKDFEDAVQYESAIAAQLDAIVTRNPQDFANPSLESSGN
ncbi:MAG: PIN domain-containing protein [Cyanothece sp. SIO2G6]|nr:PIN domain-containing protein [Cyanothece sp. SIO2G6]